MARLPRTWTKLATVAGKAALLGTAGLLLTGADKPAAQSRQNWNVAVSTTAAGEHVLGNPQAAVRLTEYVSYTCSHCADFQRQADTPMRLSYVMPGRLSVKVAHVVRDPVDLTVAMLTNCGDPKTFFKRHHWFLFEQDKWLGKSSGMSDAQMARWSRGAMADRLKAVATDFGFYDKMAGWGFSRVEVERCLADKAMAERISTQTAAAQQLGVPGTPSFAIDGVLLDAVHDWKTLDARIKARL